MFTALLDTCVLWPSLQRDFLLSLAIEGLYRPVWSSVVLEELEWHEAAKLIKRGNDEDAARQRAEALVRQLRSAFEDAEVQGWEGLQGTYGLPDRDDEHVVAAAVVAGAGAVVTHNVKDFPHDRIPAGIQVLQPAEFATNTVAVDPVQARAAVAAIASRSGRKGPFLTEDDVLDSLSRRYGMTRAVELMAQVDLRKQG
ncbi:PIN domain-containing protein [Plantactinospora endophytica]|uniref:PIN domain-containing protein n=1 Tax=Plantactinospora endophytica TaxID=673535 RepID=UPI001944487D|nr:PIN domain-containing protein [Plantactinospora endophytica]